MKRLSEVAVSIRSAYRLLGPYIKTQKKAYLGLLLLAALDTGLTLAFAWFLGRITDAAAQQHFEQLTWLVPVGIALSLTSVLSGVIGRKLEFTASARVRLELSERLLGHIMRLPASNQSKLHSGELMTHFNQDIHSMNGLLGASLIQWLRLPLVFAAVLIYMLQIHWLMAIVGTLIIPFAIGAGLFLGFILRRKTRAIHDLFGGVNRILTETLQGLSVIRSFSAEKSWHRLFAHKNNELYTHQQRYVTLQGWISAGGQVAGAFVFLVSLCLGAYFVSRRVISIGELLAFVNLSGHLLYPLTGLAGLWIGVQESSTAVDRITSVLEQEAEDSEFPATVELSGLKSIEFRDVAFRYEQETPLIERFNLTIPGGSTVAIVGASGAGKSTLFHLLQGFYKPQSGSIRINGIPINDYPTSQLRSCFTLVDQDTFLFSGTIRDNLLIARSNATDEEIEHAATIANIHSFIQSLPNRYETTVGERGVTLSGGQKQRIAIARAILKDAPILLLDEATSALDSETEFLVKQSIQGLIKGRTTLMIAHRLSTIQHADLIVVMDRGSIVQMGTHEELAKRPGLYRSLKRRQNIEERSG